jgi:two-component system nitrate/nitrite response regulator NarL
VTRLAVLASHSLRRAGLVSLLKASGFVSVDEASTLDELQDADERQSPDILLVSLASDAIEIAGLMEAVGMWAPATKVVFLSSHLDMATLSECYAAGGVGYLLETISTEALQKSFALVSTGECVFPSELVPALIDSIGLFATSSASDMEDFNLSAREISILRLLAVGLSNKVIAAKLDIAE